MLYNTTNGCPAVEHIQKFGGDEKRAYLCTTLKKEP